MVFADDLQGKNARRASRRPLRDQPTFYYHTNFCDMLGFVRTRYTGAMGKAHLAFLSEFFALSHPAQCFYVRMAGRKNRVFDLSKLSYPEIGNLYVIAEELIAADFAHAVGESDFENFLETLTKPELVTHLVEALREIKFKKTGKKDALIEVAQEHLSFDDLTISDRFLVQGRSEDLSFISFLYFGKIEENMQRFTMRDLGLIKVPDFKQEYAARFHAFDEAWAAYFYAKSLRHLRYEIDAKIVELIDTIEHWPDPESEADMSARDQLCFGLGKICEKAEDTATALSIYALGQGPKSHEREVRLRYKLGQKDWVETRLESLIDNPSSDSEYDFAVDFYARKFGKKRTSQMTDILRAGLEVRLDEALKHLPEYAAKRYFEREGFEVYRSENGVWRMLFGLLFWDELFGKQATLHNAFDRRPSNLKNGTFYTDFKAKIEDKLVRLSQQKTTQLALLKTFSSAYGKPNGIFMWSREEFDQVTALVSHAKPEGLVAIMRGMAQNYMHMKDGFPDLMRIWDGTLSFIEVKAPGDVIRRNQLTRIRQLRDAGFDVEITRIIWDVDPDQTYVVVDIETTGGGRSNHRITEIGALKVKGGKVIDEFQTLLNPERHIPAGITRLTGITNDMVKNAPKFEAVADDFKAFLEGSIFVAHNVNFDYGFIREEYGRLGRPFRFPKLCTVSSMRQYYPGLKSYSLANLCREFSIDLNGHHRALVDAKAATELLFLLNDKRCEK